MTNESSANGEPASGWLTGLHIVTLSCLAFAVPLLDLIGRSPEFLVIRRVGAIELAGLLGLMLLVAPLPFLAIAYGAGRFGANAGRAAGAAMVGALSCLVALRLTAASRHLDGAAALAVAAIAGLAAALLHHRHAAFRSFVTWLSPALVVVPAYFVLQPDVRRAVFPPDETRLQSTGAHSPVFFLVFDELSRAAIVDQQGLIDGRRYPNLARLAGDSTWYRNAYTVADTTSVAVPAMLTGRIPSAGELPLLADHPVNLFTLFGGDYRIRADEPVTRLCPLRINELGADSEESPAKRTTALWLDVSVVWLHLTMPPGWRQRLPSISTSWGGFVTGSHEAANAHGPRAQPKSSAEFYALAVEELSQGDRAERFRKFLRGIDPDDERVLYFEHVMLPHTPWEHFPSGRLYRVDGGRIEGLSGDAWGADADPVRLSAVRYLMQVEFLDRLVGEFIQALESAGIYDRSLIVLVADHGVSFRAGDSRRGYSRSNVADIVPVPLIIKSPGQPAGAVVDAPVTVLDIVPTIVDILGVKAAASFDGSSTRATPARTSRSIRLSTANAGALEIDLDDVDARKRESAREFERLIGPASDPFRYSRSAPRADLLGKPLASCTLRDGTLVASLLEPDLYRDYDPEAERAPALVTGVVRTDATERFTLALAVNGTIAATTETYPGGGGVQLFVALLPDTALRTGSNDIAILRVVAADGSPQGAPLLERTASGIHRSFAIVGDERGREQSLLVDGRSYKLGRALDGWIESTEPRGGSVRISGWAADATRKRLASEVVVFYRGKCVASGATSVAKGYVAEGLHEPAYMFSGFSFDVPASFVPGIEREGVRLFALSDDANATELGTILLRTERAPGGEYLVTSNGVRYRVDEGAVEGLTEAVEADGNGTVLRGWAADRNRDAAAERIVVVLDGRVVRDTTPSEERPNLSRGGGPALRCGFRMHFDVKPAAARRALEEGRARVLATSRDGRASELKLAAPADRPAK
ncbi:MAG: sulfatase-like hydrolase/transferase [Thermoanaerobaculia bacterium]|jgi:hypothetical protein